MNKKRIAIITATRAEYGLLMPLMERIEKELMFELVLIVTGTHLSYDYGHTIDDIYRDGFVPAHVIPILEDDNTPYGVSITIANAIKGFSKCFQEDKPDLVIILGDRTEMIGVACAALNELIPIAHIHGGEVTEGAVDDCIRHAISKMSNIHFTSTELYRHRVIQMGESPERVFNVGALGIENIINQKLINNVEIRRSVGIPENSRYAVVTFHPVTMERDLGIAQIEELCKAMTYKNDLFYVITGSNADAGGSKANLILKEFADNHNNTVFILNLGMKKYLSAVKHAAFVLGNSSSGIIEAPTLGTPTVNIGDRQRGRLMGDTVVTCAPVAADIVRTIDEVLIMEHRVSYLYGDGKTSKRIMDIISEFLSTGIYNKKGFYDICFSMQQ